MPRRSLTVAPVPGLRLGFYGKIPSRGDFVRHGLSRSLVSCWDRWLQRVCVEVRLQEGTALAAAWDVAPIWRLALDAGLCGPAPLLGVMLPSADRSGRRFPLLCAAEGAMNVAETAHLVSSLQEIGQAAVQTGSTPEEIRARFDAMGAPEPAATRAATHPACSRWWRGDAEIEMTCQGMPDAATFMHLMHPQPNFTSLVHD